MAVLDTSFAHAVRMFREDRLAESEALCRSLLRVAPGHPDITHLLAVVALRAGAIADSLVMARQAVAGEAQRGLFINTLGVVLKLAGQWDEAQAWFGRALRLDPLAVEPRLNLGGLLADRRDGGAGREIRRALALAPDSSEAHNNLGAIDMRVGNLAPAMPRFRRALAVAPQMVDAWRNLSGASSWDGRVAGALTAGRSALALAPSDAEAHDILASGLVALGDAAGALAPLRRATAIRPSFHEAGSNLLFAMAYVSAVSTAAMGAAQRAWARKLRTSVPAFANGRDPERRIRLGYLSGDLRIHPVGWNVDGLIRHHDRSRFEILLYSTTPLADGATSRFAGMADGFRDLFSAGDRDVGSAIRGDGIDVLVALAPHTAYNSPVVLAEKPAPVVVSFHGIGSTGLSTVDHWITDPVLHPEDTAEEFTESLLRLPCFYLHAPPADAPEPGPPPSVATGAVTFGSFNNPAKVTPEVVALWAKVLHAVPGSRLLLRNGRRFGDALTAARYRALFAAHGIGPERLLCEGDQLPRDAHLAGFDRVDISLDPFPFNGSTTTFESLWMGVPVVTRIGDRFVARVGVDVLSQIGLADLAAPDDEAYVATATALAADVERRAGLRSTLRARLAASPLCDAAAYAGHFETAIRGAWRQWCASP